MHVAIIGTYPPRRCGIATFTADVEAALTQSGATVTVVPVIGATEDDTGALTIRRDDRNSYVAAARALNDLDVDITLIQHEFGIFGGDAGAFVLSLAAELEMPFAVTMHTVLPHYTDVQASVVETLASRASILTVMTESACHLLVRQGVAPAELVVVIPHGAPDVLFGPHDSPGYRECLGVVPGCGHDDDVRVALGGKGDRTGAAGNGGAHAVSSRSALRRRRAHPSRGGQARG